jgi:uncharacterized membrane protein
MIEFSLALVLFLLAHMVPTAPPIRARLTRMLGRRIYLMVYSTVSLALLVWLIVAAQRAPYLPLWNPASWQWWTALLLMPFALFLLLAGLMTPNPLSVSLRKAPAGSRPSGIAAVTRHPVLWGFGLWAVAHIPPNGDVIALILFGGMALLAFGGMIIVDRKARRRLGDQWDELAREAPFIPLTTRASRSALTRLDAASRAMGVAAIAFFIWFVLDGHLRLIGLDPLAML